MIHSVFLLHFKFGLSI